MIPKTGRERNGRQKTDAKAGTYSVSMLSVFCVGMPRILRLKLVRGDVGLGKEPVVATCEAHADSYLFKVMCGPRVKAEWKRSAGDCGAWRDAELPGLADVESQAEGAVGDGDWDGSSGCFGAE